MFAWWRQRRRQQILEAAFPAGWDAIMERNVGHLRYLGDEERARLRDMVQVFLAEKQLQGCGGLVLTDEIRVTIAASACLLLLGLDHVE